MKRNLLFIVFVFCIITANAQQDSVVKKQDGKNLVKLNLTALPLKNFSGVYERKIGKKISLGLGFRLMPEDKLPFLTKIKELVDDEDLNEQLDNFKMSNFALTPELRFYFGKDVFRGFYIAPFARYAVYSANVPYKFTVEITDGSGNILQTRNKEIPLSGDIKTFTGGLQFGAQWKLSRSVYLDWFILGPHYGNSSGSIVGNTQSFDSDERDALADELQELEDSDIPLLSVKTSVNNKEARADFDGPWAGLKAGISLGIRF